VRTTLICDDAHLLHPNLSFFSGGKSQLIVLIQVAVWFADGLLIHSPFLREDGFGLLMAKGSMLRFAS